MLINAARSIAFKNVVPDDLMSASWQPYARNENIVTFHYIANAVNVVPNENQYYYTRMPSIPGWQDGFKYVFAYWDSDLNNYKLYYVKIRLL